MHYCAAYRCRKFDTRAQLLPQLYWSGTSLLYIRRRFPPYRGFSGKPLFSLFTFLHSFKGRKETNVRFFTFILQCGIVLIAEESPAAHHLYSFLVVGHERRWTRRKVHATLSPNSTSTCRGPPWAQPLTTIRFRWTSLWRFLPDMIHDQPTAVVDHSYLDDLERQVRGDSFTLAVTFFTLERPSVPFDDLMIDRARYG